MRRWRGKCILFLIIIAIFLAGIYYILITYTVTNVYVEGNIHYTQEEIKEIVMSGVFGNNSLYLASKYKNMGVENIPFVDVMDVAILTPNTIKIMVYEKSLAGYIEFMDRYLYFDKDGYIVESSNIKTVGIPQIIGLKFSHLVVGKPIPVENQEIFEGIMNITNLLNKYNLVADAIYFNSDNLIVLHFEDIKVAIGESKDLEMKLMVVPQFLKELEGKKGTLRMENYGNSSTITAFELDAV